MAVTYVKDFTFPTGFGFHGSASTNIKGYAKGGHVGQAKRTPAPASKGAGAGKLRDKTGTDHKFPGTRVEKSSGVQKPAFKHGGSTTPYCFKDGGVADGKVKDGAKKPWNPDDAVSPGSPKRSAPGQGMKNQSAARDKFATEGKGTEPATKQTGNVDRMSGYSDFKRGGKVHKKASGGKVGADRFETEGVKKAERVSDGTSKKVAGDGKQYKSGGRIANLGHYAHGGKVAAKYEKAAGTPKKTAPAQAEKKSGTAKMASGGLGRATSHKKNAAIHAKMKHNQPKGGPSLGALASALGGAGPMGASHQPSGPGMGPPPPGMAPGMGSPPGGQMGGMAPPPGGAMGPGGMSHGGGVKHVVVHHVSHRAGE